jgi:ribosomal-protein-alanine N-acetyltransferase
MKILETKRLILRHLEPDDLDHLFALYADPEVRHYFPEGTLTLEETKEELEWFLNGHPKYPELGLWATIHKETGQFIGRCGLLPWTIDGRDEVEVAYLIDKTFWGQGLGTEAAQGVLDYGFETLNLSRLICLIDRENRASIKVATHIGMSFEKESADEHGPFLLYSISAPDNQNLPNKRAKWQGVPFYQCRATSLIPSQVRRLWHE